MGTENGLKYKNQDWFWLKNFDWKIFNQHTDWKILFEKFTKF